MCSYGHMTQNSLQKNVLQGGYLLTGQPPAAIFSLSSAQTAKATRALDGSWPLTGNNTGIEQAHFYLYPRLLYWATSAQRQARSILS